MCVLIHYVKFNIDIHNGYTNLITVNTQYASESNSKKHSLSI